MREFRIEEAKSQVSRVEMRKETGGERGDAKAVSSQNYYDSRCAGAAGPNPDSFPFLPPSSTRPARKRVNMGLLKAQIPGKRQKDELLVMRFAIFACFGSDFVEMEREDACEKQKGRYQRAEKRTRKL
ncbi:hypothetical protein WR25_00633 [Diploscapter pachys]|uniref:Uncharacterized protein n=1 Tax=Diploscapter pachys TaxID=2018661 RepID=A0A2A2L6V5_9BILA|nr:hypothetical protein WR25_00633 [Diploscapter pachys]